MQKNVIRNKKAFSVKEVSQDTGLSQSFIRLEIKRGKLKAGKFGARVLVTAENLSNYLNKGDISEK